MKETKKRGFIFRLIVSCLIYVALVVIFLYVIKLPELMSGSFATVAQLYYLDIDK
ncbi:hypothetical protein ACJRPK_13940 [Aquimarina sp. 2-A2]|uniref:hypothetical protein n=1 Tax=Aquimarina sp. 2-A2 TaxID=3382644 RepID=UPI00387EF303